MDIDLLEKFLKLIRSENDSDALMGLRGAQNLFQSEKTSLEDALRHAARDVSSWRKEQPVTVDAAAPAKKKENVPPPPVTASGMPQCRITGAGVLEIIPAGKTEGHAYPLPGESAQDAETIAINLKDAIVASILNKSRFKLKMADTKDNQGNVTECTLQAEYERGGMVPIKIWTLKNRGEVGGLAAVLRKAMSTSLPELFA